MALHCPDSMTAVTRLLKQMTAAKLESLGDIYSPGVVFQDPLHDARGLAQLRGVFSHLVGKPGGMSVELLDAHGDERTGFLLWTRKYQHGGEAREIRGTSHFKFAADGRISEQLDHWDASFVVYGEFPLLGWLMRKIKQRAQLLPETSGT
jgi:steroid delta-isomerase